MKENYLIYLITGMKEKWKNKDDMFSVSFTQIRGAPIKNVKCLISK